LNAENERRALAISMMSNKKRHTYERVMKAVSHKKAAVDLLADKAKTAAKKGDTGTGAAVGAKPSAGATTHPKPAAGKSGAHGAKAHNGSAKGAVSGSKRPRSDKA
jgi:hypothetical protein